MDVGGNGRQRPPHPHGIDEEGIPNQPIEDVEEGHLNRIPDAEGKRQNRHNHHPEEDLAWGVLPPVTPPPGIQAEGPEDVELEEDVEEAERGDEEPTDNQGTCRLAGQNG